MTKTQAKDKQDEKERQDGVRGDESSKSLPEVQSEEMQVQVERRIVPKVSTPVAYRIGRDVHPAIIAKVLKKPDQPVTVDTGIDLVYFDISTGRSLLADKVVQGLGNRQWWVDSGELACAVALEHTGRTN